MTRVLYIAPEYPAPGANAAQVRANALLPRLREVTDLEVLAFPPDGVAVSIVTERHVHAVPRAKLGIARLTAATLGPRPRAFVRYDTPEARRTLGRLLNDFQPDLVHFDSIGTMALLDVVLSAPHRPKVVAHTHDAVSQLYRRLVSNGSLVQRLSSWTEYRKFLAHEQRELRMADAIIVDSPEDAAHLTRVAAGVTVATIPLGVDLNTFSPDGVRAQLCHPSLVFSGSMGSVQSADAATFLVRDVMPLVWDRHSECHLYLVGSSPAPQVQQLASPRVHVTGFVQDLPSYLRGASVYVCPLRLGSGMRTRVIEALACGAPTVATRMAVRGLTEPSRSRQPLATVGNVPWLTADAADDIAAAIDEVLSHKHPQLRSCAAEYARDNYSWDAVAKQAVRLYRSIGAP